MINTNWTEREDDILRARCTAGATYKQIGAELGRTHAACRKRANKMGFKNASRRAMDDEEIRIMKQILANGGAHHQVAKRLGRSVPSCICKAHRLGLISRGRPYKKPVPETALERAMKTLWVAA